VNYIEGEGDLSLGQASLTGGSGARVIVDLGRSNPPFNNGTVHGLGAKVSDFFSYCLAKDGTQLGDLQISGDFASDYTRYALFNIPNTGNCTSSDNALCWSFTQKRGLQTLGLIAAENPQEGHYYIGNGEDPTVISLRSVSASSPGNLWVPVGLALIALCLGAGGLFLTRKRE
jgi:hypothetical protein